MRILFIIILLFTLFPNLQASEYYVNQSTGNDANDGSQESPWKTVDFGLGLLTPGDVLNLSAGTYQPIAGIPGGGPGLPITIKSVDGEKAVINGPGTNNGIVITNDYVIIDGLEIKNVKNNGINVQANYITIRNCIIHDAALAVKANTNYINHHILIEYCSFYNFSDIAIFPDAAEKFIIRNNVMYNGKSVMMDPGGVRELLIENNFVVNPNKLGALKIRWGNIEDVAGPNCNGAVVRNNIFLEGDKYNILLASANGAMVYNNVLINNLLNGGVEKGVVYMQQDPADINEGKPNGPNRRNVLKNNIIQMNGGDSNDDNHNALIEVREDMEDDIKTNEFDHNLYYKSAGSLYFISGTASILENEVAGWGEQFDIHSIVGLDPELSIKDTLESPEDYMPKPTSPVIDKGGQLTVAVQSGISNIIPVKDSRYFYSGHGMISGDKIIIGSSDTATVIDRDIDENTITIDKTLAWDEGDSVSLIFSGSVPDIGAYEYGIEKEIANAAGAEELFNMINKDAGVSNVSEYTSLPEKFYISQNYPNPFNPVTHIDYTLRQKDRVELTVYNLLGEKIVTL
ncbi:right-handed parallel beta-helix repeat-containing protein, partial [candidate division KSB1 bacterium]|nr:right-handed parallel beta-helix repeat-containing protein [candidate division KSB1 bacterium]